MCGIAVIFGNKVSTTECINLIRKMTNVISHRGPDDEGIVIFQNPQHQPLILFGEATPKEAASHQSLYCHVTPKIHAETAAVAGIGHRRLSIVDLSVAGHQPMCTPDGRYWITYNGEIYNYLELRIELEAKGYTFQTNTDTEIVLQAYACWGVKCLHKFNGMFAFAIVDTKEQSIFSARDRFGVKPLYMWQSPRGTIALASEIKQFACFPEWRAHLNHQSAYDFLNWGMTDHKEQTFFQGVKQLLAGHYFKCHLDETPTPQQWYSIPLYTIPYSFDEASSRFHDLFVDSIKLRLRADVEVGSCLSGGLDSSSIVCVVDRLLKSNSVRHQQNVFSACSYDRQFDEREYVEEVVKGRELSAHYIYPSVEELKQHLHELVKTQDEPFGSTSIFAQWLIFKCVKQAGVPVMLDGQGADEQLAGYHSFYGYKMLELFREMRWIQLLREGQTIKRYHQNLSPYMLLGNRLLPERLRRSLSKIIGRTTNYPSWLNDKKLNADYVTPLKNLSFSSVNDWGRILISTSNLPMLLRYEDRNSMAHSIESRTPFLDYRVVEFCSNLPTEYKLKGEWTKHLLRESMSPYLPQKIVQRLDKMAFVTAEEQWMKSQPQFFRGLLKESVDYSDGLVNETILNDFDKMVKGNTHFNHLFWRVISFGQWMNEYIPK